MMKMGEDETSAINKPMPEGLEAADHWILSRLNNTIREVTDNMDKFELGIAVQKVYDFIWDEFCDWYIEMVKPRLYNKEQDGTTSRQAALWTLQTVLIDALKLLHPYMPFITEEIFCNIQDEEESIMISSWPVYKEEWNFAQDEKEIETIKEAIRGIRNVRTQMNVPPSRKAKVFVVSENDASRDAFERGRLFLQSMAYASEVAVQKDKEGIADDAVSVVLADATIYIPFSDLVDIAAEIERLEKEKAKLEGELKRSKNMLSNEKFLAKAPESKIAEEKEKQQKYQQTYDQITERLSQLSR
jgi:valyl-tRNA synthetase